MHFEDPICFGSNFFVFQSYELRFSENFNRFLIRSFPVSFCVGNNSRIFPTCLEHVCVFLEGENGSLLCNGIHKLHSKPLLEPHFDTKNFSEGYTS